MMILYLFHDAKFKNVEANMRRGPIMHAEWKNSMQKLKR